MKSWLGWKNPAEEPAKVETKPDVPLVPVLPSPPVVVAANDYLRMPPVNIKPVHVPKPVEIYKDQTGYYVANGIRTLRTDN